MYKVGNLPSDPKDLQEFVVRELNNISRAMTDQTDLIRLKMVYSAPPKPRDGDVRLFDGVLYNPGSGAGYYGYRAGAWRFLG